MSGFFITGTDTGVGKTELALALTKYFAAHGKHVAAYKPVAAGAEPVEGIWQNEDAQRLRQVANIEQSYAQTNPCCFAPAIAPHIAARESGRSIALQPLIQGYENLAAHSDCQIVEGAGGWLVPLNATQDMSHLAVALQLPVILVIGLRLGCINHALLSVQAIKASGLSLAGFVLNSLQRDMPREKDNICSLKERIDAPCMAVVPWQETTKSPLMVDYLDMSVLN
ncbi:MAG: dethiobiotin synthase [gamma proteobacterium symbiont of Bathyaustriella thionipta]|nr:dethiobiotin synthase [gamma proteobacterium symbiont of Bathyaustriella thionipta]